MARLHAFLLVACLFGALGADAADRSTDPCASIRKLPANLVVLDGARISSMKDFHEQVRRSPFFPDHYGNNLDALYDVLVSLKGVTFVVWLNASQSEARLGEDFTRLIETMDEAKATLPPGRFCLFTRK